MKIIVSASGAALIAAIGLAAAGLSGEVPDAVQNLIGAKCATCHKGFLAPKGLKLDPDGLPNAILDVPSREKPDLKLVDTKAPESSYLLMKVDGAEGISGKKMPPPGKPQLTEDEFRLLRDWIASLKKASSST